MSAEPGYTAVILAAQRGGQLDPLAAQAGVTHKCLVPIVGKPLIRYVLDALAPLSGLGRIRICIEPDAVDAVRDIVADCAGLSVPVEFVASAPTITESVYASAQDASGPLLITTADNVNLTPDAAGQTMAAIAAGADVALALARRRAVLTARSEAHLPAANVANVGPYRFADDAYSNCNLYAMAGPSVMSLAESFREGGQFSKKPARLIKTVGLLNILLFRLRLLTLEQAMKRLSKRAGIKVVPVVLDDGAQAIDVDNPRTYRIAEAILRAKAA